MFIKLLRLLLLIAGIGFISSILLLLVIYRPDPATHDGSRGILLLIIGSVYATCLLTLFSLGIFFNLIDEVRSNLVLRLMSFLLFPVCFVIYFIIRPAELFFKINAAAFLLLSFIYFIKFSRSVKRELLTAADE